ncbi:MAG: 30S ribosomal protein S12 methylthiotransferase RimO, partial [Desulfosudaceae bacterium]
MKVHLTTLGCAKNQVDSELLAGRLEAAGHAVCDDPEAAEIIIVNTCSFIEPAVNESIDTILALAEHKTGGSCRRLIVCGCLPERYGRELAETLPEVDFFFGTGAFDRLAAALDEGWEQAPRCTLPPPEAAPEQGANEPRCCQNPCSVYIKIAEGCDRHCTYCIIPRLRGRQRSRRPEHILAEARQLIAAGARELILVAQETTAYGRDLTPPRPLADLLATLSDLSDRVWIRVLYMHPASLGADVIAVITARKNICSYFDIPIQHASDAVLRRMGRGHTAAAARRLLEQIRGKDPGAVLRTTALVGFPGETEADFAALLDFARQIQFDHLGVFIYSDADDIRSFGLDGRVDRHTAADRHDRLMEAQAEISRVRNQARLNRIY